MHQLVTVEFIDLYPINRRRYLIFAKPLPLVAPKMIPSMRN
tara:strand:- start:767 stop:889 length:123 start_codon:yes stop_codon:yes gene_type:complete